MLHPRWATWIASERTGAHQRKAATVCVAAYEVHGGDAWRFGAFVYLDIGWLVCQYHGNLCLTLHFPLIFQSGRSRVYRRR